MQVFTVLNTIYTDSSFGNFATFLTKKEETRKCQKMIKMCFLNGRSRIKHMTSKVLCSIRYSNVDLNFNTLKSSSIMSSISLFI